VGALSPDGTPSVYGPEAASLDCAADLEFGESDPYTVENLVNHVSYDLHTSGQQHTDFVILLVPWRAASGESKVSLSPSNLPCWSEWCTYNTFLSACIFAVLKVNAQIVSIITVQECCEGI